MIMAAGLGTRMRPLTHHCPKALIPLMDIPIVQFTIDSLAQAGVTHAAANVHHLPELAKTGLQACHKSGMSLALSDESKLLLGSAGGIKNALPLLRNEPFFLANADVLTDINWQELGDFHQYSHRRFGTLLSLAVFPAGPAGGLYREIKVDPGSRLITGLGELVAQRPYFIGAAVLEPEALQLVSTDMPSEFVPSVLAPAIQAGKAAAFLTSGVWFDLGTPVLWNLAHLDLIQRLESGRLSPLIRRRLEDGNLRKAAGIWVSRKAPRILPMGSWEAPCYWSPVDLASSQLQPPPAFMQAGSVIYGSAP